MTILHEIDLRPLIQGLIANGDRLGERSLAEAKEMQRARGVPAAAASAAFLARRARCLVVHSEEDRASIESLDVRTPIVVLPREEAPGLARIRRVLRLHDSGTRALKRVVDDTLGFLTDPARKATARWAGGLVDCGATLESVQRGDGGRYAAALAEFLTP